MREIYPLTIVKDRYSGAYSGGEYTAWNYYFSDVPTEINDDDVTCHNFWEDNNIPVGTGDTPEEALRNLRKKLELRYTPYADIIKGAFGEDKGGKEMETMKKREVGDYIKIKENLKEQKYYGGVYFNCNMVDNKGKTSKIIGVKSNGYLLEIDKGEWLWSEEMVEDIKIEKGDILKIRDTILLNNIGEDDWECTINFLSNLSYEDLGKTYEVTYENDDGSLDVRSTDGEDDGELISKEIFTLEEKNIKEMTLAEVCKELGYNVKIIKE